MRNKFNVDNDEKERIISLHENASKKQYLNLIVEEEAAGGKKSVMFGWCMDGNDEECIGEFPGHRCSCGCHENKKTLESGLDD
jgi:hypothetical protein